MLRESVFLSKFKAIPISRIKPVLKKVCSEQKYGFQNRFLWVISNAFKNIYRYRLSKILLYSSSQKVNVFSLNHFPTQALQSMPEHLETLGDTTDQKESLPTQIHTLWERSAPANSKTLDVYQDSTLSFQATLHHLSAPWESWCFSPISIYLIEKR